MIKELLINNCIYFNVLANLVIFFSVAVFIIFVFGRENSKMNELPFIERYGIKAGLCLVCCGSLMNLFEFRNASLSETIMNIGLAIVFLWGAFFHFKFFVKKK